MEQLVMFDEAKMNRVLDRFEKDLFEKKLVAPNMDEYVLFEIDDNTVCTLSFYRTDDTFAIIELEFEGNEDGTLREEPLVDFYIADYDRESMKRWISYCWRTLMFLKS